MKKNITDDNQRNPLELYGDKQGWHDEYLKYVSNLLHIMGLMIMAQVCKHYERFKKI